MRLTIWVPTYNWGANLIRAIKSIKYLWINLDDFEILVLDNQSNDETFQNIEKLKYEFQNIRYIKNDKNYWRVWNWNRVLEESKGDYIMFLFANDQLSENNNIVEILNCMIRNNIYISKSNKININNNWIISNKFKMKVISLNNYIHKNLFFLSSLPFAPTQTFIFDNKYLKNRNIAFDIKKEIIADIKFWLDIYCSTRNLKILITNSYNIIFDDSNINRLHNKLSYFCMLSEELWLFLDKKYEDSLWWNKTTIIFHYLSRINFIQLFHIISNKKMFSNYSKGDKNQLKNYILNNYKISLSKYYILNILSFINIFKIYWFIQYLRKKWNSI